ncbi:CLUMA_CG017432, isoform A, partial [Clunio marinus]
ENIDTLATAFNKTAAHLVNKIKFFIHADNVKTNFKLKNIVGFTDTRENYRPFHVLKYIADNYVEDYDFFYLIEDAAYLNAKTLVEQLSHISMSFDLYMGTKIEDREEKYCDLRAGIVFSSSIIKKIQKKLDSCVRGADGNHHSLNIGKCVEMAANIKECQESFQGVTISSYSLSNHKIYRDLHQLRKDPFFNTSTSIFPVTTTDDIYILHAYFSRLHLEAVQSRIKSLEREAQNVGNGTVAKNVLEVHWPLGVPNSVKPAVRHDMLVWTHLNLTHSFMGDEGVNVKPLNKIDSQNIKKILDGILNEVGKKYPELIYESLQSAYMKFDTVRGMDYRIHLNFRDSNGELVLKGFEVVKPISLIQIIPSPYVTESTRIAMIVPTFVHRIEETMNFIKRYEEICMQNKDSTTLMLVLLYNSNASNKAESDVFYNLKNFAIETSKRIKTDDSRIAWVSIRLPSEYDYTYHESDEMLSSMYANQEILSLAATDLALRKIGLESLVLLFTNVAHFKNDFLNRVRMNTIQGFQVFSPIGFMQYPCKYTALCNSCENCDVSQSGGYFDRHNYDIISFYSRDYVEARKKLEPYVAIVRKDADIINLQSRQYQDVTRVIDIFIRAKTSVHLLRAVEPTLRFGIGLEKFLEGNPNGPMPKCEYQNTSIDYKCINLASRKQLGEAVMLIAQANY